jgi:demethylspheroidene O-methyltransferase
MWAEATAPSSPRAARKHDQLKLTLFDLPAVADIAREKLNAAGLSQRVTVASGSFLTIPCRRGRTSPP